MKKAFESGRIWTFLSAFIFMMMCGLVVLAVNTLPSSEPGTRFNHYKTNELKQQDGVSILTTGDWNDLMEGLNHMLDGAIPEGAIIAFDSNDCPDGWNKYSNGKVPGGDVNKIWCKKGEVQPKIKINFVTQANYKNNNGSSTSAFQCFETFSVTVDYGTTIYSPGVNTPSVNIGDRTYNIKSNCLPEYYNYVDGKTYKFNSIAQQCGPTAIKNCDILANYVEQ